MKALDKQVGGDHYKMVIQPAEYVHKNKIGYLEGNVIKYVSRHRNKNGKQDIEKAIHYLQMILEMDYPESFTFSGDGIDMSEMFKNAGGGVDLGAEPDESYVNQD